jgi:hypothetical protein
MANATAPSIVTLTSAQVEELLGKLTGLVPEETYRLLEAILRSFQWLVGALEAKNTTLGRLRRLLFGQQTEKTSTVLPLAGAGDPQAATRTKAKGHGRKAAGRDYPGARRIPVPHPQHRPGALCPKCLKGKLYWLTVPARLVRIVAQPMFEATVFELERLRCALCGALLTAPPPPEAGLQKYDPSCGIMLAVSRYGMGVPMYRTAKWQAYFGVPLPPATQWEQIEAVSRIPERIYEALLDTAAQAHLLHNDDTPMRVQSLRQESSDSETSDRTGIFTTNIIAQVGPHPVALFFTGQNHAGENLNQVLQRRDPHRAEKPLQMCDALSRNLPKEFETLVCKCLLHGRRRFIDILEHFPQECRQVLESLREVYHFEALTKEQHLSPELRLVFHQHHSRPVMEALHAWMREQLDQKRVEPNSGLGEAIRYMLKHWEGLTRFLSVPGAPLDNNIAERGLKMAILHRKNSLSYRTLHGARIGDIFMSLIHTAELNQANPFDYLMALNQHPAQAEKDPARWLPWNYREMLVAANTG